MRVLAWVSTVLLALLCAYVVWGTQAELQLISLLRGMEELKQDDPRVISDESELGNPRTEEIYERDEERDKWFPWVKPIREGLVATILAGAAGFLGGFARSLLDHFRGIPLRLTTPWAGLIVGPLLLAVAVVTDATMMEGKLHFKPAGVLIGCILAGIAWETAWDFIFARAKRVGG